MREQTNFSSQFFCETEITDWANGRNVKDTGQRHKSYPRLPRHSLPSPTLPTHYSLSDGFLLRESSQDLKPEVLTLSEVSSLLAAIGLRPSSPHLATVRRTYPSAGARYPAETYIIALNCNSLPPGLYHYAINEHELEELCAQDFGEQLVVATNDERLLAASCVLIFSLVYGRVVEKYGKRGIRYGLIELGHMAQNISLMACALEKGCYEVGGFIDSMVNTWLDIDNESETATLLMVISGKR